MDLLPVTFTPLVMAKLTPWLLQRVTQRQRRALLDEILDNELVTVIPHNSLDIYGRDAYEYTQKGLDLARQSQPHHVLGMDASVPTDAEQSAFVALWYYLLLKGGHKSHFGREGYVGNNLEILHVLSCGLDPQASSTPRDDLWEEFGGTFHDNDVVRGVRGRATCRCGTVKHYEVVLHEEGAARVILGVSDPKALLP